MVGADGGKPRQNILVSAYCILLLADLARQGGIDSRQDDKTRG
jgi:hypothetical protein